MAIRVKTFLERYFHLFVAFVLTALVIKALTYCLSLLHMEVHRQPQAHFMPETEKHAPVEHRPHAQEIAESMNTFWMSFHEKHCKNVCEASWIACQARRCDLVPGVKTPWSGDTS